MVRELRERREELAGLGYDPTWEAAYENASAALKGTLAEGGPDAMKASYQFAKRENRASRGHFFTKIAPERRAKKRGSQRPKK